VAWKAAVAVGVGVGVACLVGAEGKSNLPRMNAGERGQQFCSGSVIGLMALSVPPASAFIRVEKFLTC